MKLTHPPSLPAWIAIDITTKLLLERVEKIAATSSTVLIMGESGTGKDHLAQLLHFLSPRRHEPMVKIDCSSLPADLIESELFGYEKGAFTGAHQSKPGRLEMAGNGTLILDEIAALTMPLQAKLLRVIEERSFERLGGRNTIHIRARLLTLTNVDLEQAVAQRAFREDLYYRLFVLPVVIPPLRDRKGDILPLVDHFLNSMAVTQHSGPFRLAPEARRALVQYGYPGNVRELRNLIQRALIWANGSELKLSDFPPYVNHGPGGSQVHKSLEEVERDHIEAVLRRFRGNREQVAATLGISSKTLRKKRLKYQMDLPWPRRVPGFMAAKNDPSSSPLVKGKRRLARKPAARMRSTPLP